MDKDLFGQENNEIRGSLSNKKNQESLEISSTGYGYVSVPQKMKRRKADDQ